MLTKTEAFELVSKELRRISCPGELFVVIERETIERPFGWVFFYNSKKFLETGIFRHRLLGNGPIIVNKISGAIEFQGTSRSPEQVIEDYEKKLGIEMGRE